MSEKPQWPSYDVGPPDSVFAVGVAGIKYAQLEYVLSDLFRVLLDISINETSAFFARTRSVQIILGLMEARIKSMYLPDEVRERIEAFLSGFRTCNQNRNLLMHSNIQVSLKEATTLFKSNKQGELVLCKPSTEELRQVADDMNVYFGFGIELLSALATCGFDFASLETRVEPFQWPDIPPAPKHLDYKSPNQLLDF